jgi:hypothetical protein
VPTERPDETDEERKARELIEMFDRPPAPAVPGQESLFDLAASEDE